MKTRLFGADFDGQMAVFWGVDVGPRLRLRGSGLAWEKVLIGSVLFWGGDRFPLSCWLAGQGWCAELESCSVAAPSPHVISHHHSTDPSVLTLMEGQFYNKGLYRLEPLLNEM